MGAAEKLGRMRGTMEEWGVHGEMCLKFVAWVLVKMMYIICFHGSICSSCN